MFKKIIFILFQILIFTAVISSVYYFLFLKPKIERQEKITSAAAEINIGLLLLVQNRIAYIELTRLDADSVNFNAEKSALVATLKKTNREGLDNPEIDDKAKEIFQRQDKLLERVFATKSFEEGAAILKSEEGLELLTDQTNLILHLRQELEELEKQLE